jgi:hypothetical protein
MLLEPYPITRAHAYLKIQQVGAAVSDHRAEVLGIGASTGTTLPKSNGNSVLYN